LHTDETVGPGHAYACWYPVGTDAGREALARNQAERNGAGVGLTGAATS
jgi:hypothetical protein